MGAGHLRHEHADISVHLQTTILSDKQIEDIQAICAEVGDKLETTSFEQKRQIIDLLDVRGTLAIENEEKVVYVKCILGQQLLSVARTSHLSCNHKGTQVVLKARLVIHRKRNNLADVLFAAVKPKVEVEQEAR